DRLGKRPMKINILLPFYPKFPVGGFKVFYEYANRLADRRHAVTILHPCTVEQPTGWKARLARTRKLATDRLSSQNTIGWHALREHIRLLSVPDLSEQYVPEADVTLASSWATAEMAQWYSSKAGKIFQIVYDYELWMTADGELRRRMESAFRAMKNCIATSPSVTAMLNELGIKPVAYIPCGLDTNEFDIDIPIKARAATSVGFQVRAQPSKGTADAIAALVELQSRHPDKLRLSAFGPEPVKNFPDHIDFQWSLNTAELRAFYNSISIFVFPSHFEGWGLPGMEALACGAALVAADSVGLRDYASHEETALIVPPSRPDLLADAIERLIGDDQLRHRLARQGSERVRQFTWTRAVDALEGCSRER
ncbi:MAG TPA: glycosyltransferase family 4 protein, partial [Pyrinomonadaceae bacterium]|nr:glycosyltransferase family 4 protein [Pyrinomonadaceae bacterium]